MFFKKSVLQKCSKFTGDHPCKSVISIKFHKQKVLHKSAFLGMLTSVDCIKIKVISMVLNPNSQRNIFKDNFACRNKLLLTLIILTKTFYYFFAKGTRI